MRLIHEYKRRLGGKILADERKGTGFGITWAYEAHFAVHVTLGKDDDRYHLAGSPDEMEHLANCILERVKDARERMIVEGIAS